MIKNQIRALRQEGKTYEEIATLVGCSKSMVNYYCAPNGVEKSYERSKKYKASNPVIRKIDAFTSSNRRLAVKGLENKIVHFDRKEKTHITKEMIFTKLSEQNGKCYLTGVPIDLAQPSTYSFDHIIPVIKDGPNSLENLGICTQEVNMAKSSKTPEEFFELCKRVLIHNGYEVIKKMVPNLGNAPSLNG